MGQSVFPAPVAASKTRKVETLLSGTSWTVPAGVTYVNVTLNGGGGGGGGTRGADKSLSSPGLPGARITSTVNTTPGAAISYSIGAGGGGGGNDTNGGAGGSTTFTGATTAPGGTGGTGTTNNGTSNIQASGYYNGGNGTFSYGNVMGGGTGGSGWIEIEYWV